MYEQVAHSLLNSILDELNDRTAAADFRHFFTRLGANFYAIHSLFTSLYGRRSDWESQLTNLVRVMAAQYSARPASLKRTDIEREHDHRWFLSQNWVGMAMYSEGFAGNLDGLRNRLSYLQELGVNILHVLPILECPQGASDGGYAVSNYRNVDSRAGTNEDLVLLAESMRKRGMLLALDVVMNHTSNEHEWAKRAREGDEKYQAYYYVYDDREIPDMFEEAMPEIFPETSPGNFVWDDDMQKWVMSVFHEYQWDLNYTNPAVFIEMLDIVLYWANRGADIVRLDAVAFLWKKIGTTCQNEHEAHLILQLLKDCCQVTAPGVLFIAEAIVAPVDIAKYFGQDAIVAKECEIAYNATFMALLWDAVATKSSNLLNRGVKNLPQKLDRATWLNYIRSHDDIGLGFDDADVIAAGYNPTAHRRFLVDYYTGAYDTSTARGRPFGQNAKTGDARISGTTASLCGLEAALGNGNEDAIREAVDVILLLHSLIMAFGGIPLLYYGDEIGTLNNYDFENHESRRHDSRWIHRPYMDWQRAELRHTYGTVEQRIYDGIRKLIAIRKHVSVFADLNNREHLDLDNEHVFSFARYDPNGTAPPIVVVANFDIAAHAIPLSVLAGKTPFRHGHLMDLCTGEAPESRDDALVISPLRCYWLTDAQAPLTA